VSDRQVIDSYFRGGASSCSADPAMVMQPHFSDLHPVFFLPVQPFCPRQAIDPHTGQIGLSSAANPAARAQQQAVSARLVGAPTFPAKAAADRSRKIERDFIVGSAFLSRHPYLARSFQDDNACQYSADIRVIFGNDSSLSFPSDR
jgi:hypothetical protein